MNEPTLGNAPRVKIPRDPNKKKKKGPRIRYDDRPMFATQGGGTAVYQTDRYYFHSVPNVGEFKVGDPVPSEWSVQYIRHLYRALPKKERKIESRNQRERTFKSRHHPDMRRRTIRRAQKKNAKLALKGTWRRVSKARIDACFHWAGVQMAHDERRAARKANQPLHFYKGDTLRVVNIDDCEEGLRVGDICTMEDRSSEYRPFIIVKLRRNGRKKQIEKGRFILHERNTDEDEY